MIETDTQVASEGDSAVQIRVNGELREIRVGVSIADLLEELSLGSMRLAVACNGKVISKSEHQSTAIVAGDAIEIVRMVGGG